MKSLVLFLVLIFCASPIFSQIINNIDRVGTTSDGLTAVKKDGKWGFINNEGNLIIDYRSDLVMNKETNSPVFNSGLCIIEEIKEGIPYYGCINIKGEKSINTEFLGVTDFENGFAIALKTSKKSRGKSMLGKEIIDNYYDEILIDANGKTIEYLYGTKMITLSKGFYKKPEIVSKILSDKLVATRANNGKWKIYKL